MGSFVNDFIVIPIRDMVGCLLKPRRDGLRVIIFMAFFNYGVYLFIIQAGQMRYLHMRRVFTGESL